MLTADELARGLPLDRTLANLSSVAAWAWLGSTILVLIGVTVGLLIIAARDFMVNGAGVRFRSIACGRQVLDQNQILRPVIDRGSFGGVMYFKRGSRTASVLITHADAFRLSRMPFYHSLPVSPQFARRPELLRKYENRFRPT
jgi:hypothetical protein